MSKLPVVGKLDPQYYGHTQHKHIYVLSIAMHKDRHLDIQVACVVLLYSLWTLNVDLEEQTDTFDDVPADSWGTEQLGVMLVMTVGLTHGPSSAWSSSSYTDMWCIA